MREYTSVTAEEEPNPLAGVSFTLDGETFECLGYMNVLEMAELARQASGGAQMADAATLALIAEPLAQAFGEAEYQRFRQHCKGVPDTPDPETGAQRWKRPPTPTGVVMQIISDLNEEIQDAVTAATGRPTRPPARSGSGVPEPGDRISRVISLQTGDVQVVQMPEPQDHKPPRTRQDAKSEITSLGGQPAGPKPRRRRTG